MTSIKLFRNKKIRLMKFRKKIKSL